MSNVNDLLPTAQDYQKKAARRKEEEAEKWARAQMAADDERKALIDALSEPSNVSDEEGIRRAKTMIERAVRNGLKEVQVHRFPNELCTDRGRAINQGEPGWEETLTGLPREIYVLYDKYFRPRGYKLRVEIIDYPHGMPGDVAMTLVWA
jgi:hypothetical protein